MRLRILLLLLVWGTGLSAQTPTSSSTAMLTSGSPEASGMSAQRLARIDAMLKEAVEEGAIPGAVALIARKGKIVFLS